MIVLAAILSLVIVGLIFDLQVTNSIDPDTNKMAISCFIVCVIAVLGYRFLEPILYAWSAIKYFAISIRPWFTPDRIFIITVMLICGTLFTAVYFKNRRERKELLEALRPGRTVTIYVYGAMGVGRKSATISSVNKKLKVVNTDKGHFKFRNIVI